MTENAPAGVSNLQGAPMFYADQIAALAAGPYVCRLTFGVQEDDESEYPRAVVTVAIPTVALLQLLAEVGSTVRNPTFKKRMNASLQRISEAMDNELGSPGAAAKPAAKRRKARAS